MTEGVVVALLTTAGAVMVALLSFLAVMLDKTRWHAQAAATTTASAASDSAVTKEQVHHRDHVRDQPAPAAHAARGDRPAHPRALVTTKDTSPAQKVIYLAFLSLVTGLLSQPLAAINAGIPYNLFAGLIQGIGAFHVAVALHFGLWKPTGVSAAVQLSAHRGTPRNRRRPHLRAPSDDRRILGGRSNRNHGLTWMPA